MNKTMLFVVFATLAALGLIGYVIVLVFSPENAPAFVGTLVSILAIVSGSATTFYMLGKTQSTLEEQKNTLEQVKTQTNGNLSALREQLAEKDRLLADKDRQLLQVVQAAPPAPSP